MTFFLRPEVPGLQLVSASLFCIVINDMDLLLICEGLELDFLDCHDCLVQALFCLVFNVESSMMEGNSSVVAEQTRSVLWKKLNGCLGPLLAA